MPIQLEIISFSSTDVSNLKGWRPRSLRDVYFPLCIEIAEKNRTGSNLFQVMVATPEGIRFFGEKYGMIPDRNILICLNYRWDDIEKRIAHIVALCSKDSWHESMQSLQRFFQWEHENDTTAGQNNIPTRYDPE